MNTRSKIGSAITSLIMGIDSHVHLLNSYLQLTVNIIAMDICIIITKTSVICVKPKLSTPDSEHK